MLDIENDDIRGTEAGFGPTQYTDADILIPESEIGTKEDEERRTLTQILLGTESTKRDKINQDKCSEEDMADEKNIDSLEKNCDSFSMDEMKSVIADLKQANKILRQSTLCNICLNIYVTPVVATVCWHVHCEQCWLRALGSKKLCPQCKLIIQPKDLRKIYL